MASRAQVTAVALLALFAVVVIAAGGSHTSIYQGPAGSGKSFQAAKTALLAKYAQANKTTYKLTSEKVADNSYTVTYEFPDAKTLDAYQAWQYSQPDYKAKLEKFSQTPKVVGGRRLA